MKTWMVKDPEAALAYATNLRALGQTAQALAPLAVEDGLFAAPDEAAASQQAAAAKAAFEAGAGQLQSLSALIEKGNNPKEIEAVKPVVADFKELDAAYARWAELDG